MALALDEVADRDEGLVAQSQFGAPDLTLDRTEAAEIDAVTQYNDVFGRNPQIDQILLQATGNSDQSVGLPRGPCDQATRQSVPGNVIKVGTAACNNHGFDKVLRDPRCRDTVWVEVI